MLRAARLALEGGNGPAFDAEDTKSTPDGAMAAARGAVAAGAGVMVGPLTAAETAAVARIAHPGNIPVLAFTSDNAQAQPGVWIMGITPAQQVQTLVQGLQADNKSRLGAVLPRNPFGDALADGLVQAAGEARLPPPQLVRYQPGPGALDAALGQIASSTGAPSSGPAAPPPPAAQPSIDALLLGTTAAPPSRPCRP